MQVCLVKLFKTTFFVILLINPFLNVSSSQDLEEIVFSVTAGYDSSMMRNVFAFDSVTKKSFLIRKGSTVLLDLSDESLNSHPLSLSATPDGIHSGGAPIETSEKDSILAVTIGTDTPNQLFVYCNRHPKMGSELSLDTIGNTTDLFLSDFNLNTEEIFVPRVYVDDEPPKLFSLRLGLSPDRSTFNLISASEGYVSEFAPSDRRQAKYHLDTNKLEIPVLFALEDFFSAILKVEGSQLSLTSLVPLQEEVMSQSSDDDQSADGQPSSDWAIKYDSNY